MALQMTLTKVVSGQWLEMIGKNILALKRGGLKRVSASDGTPF